jgi:hypothetical protein
VLSDESVLALELGFVEKRLAEKWSWLEAKEAVRRYKRFLLLIRRYPKETLAPAPDMDEAWHAHILFTREYMRDCEAVFGFYLHHSPVREGEGKRMKKAQSTASSLFMKEFGESYHLELDISSLW